MQHEIIKLDTYHVDHFGSIKATEKSYKHIFVVTDAQLSLLQLKKQLNACDGKLQSLAIQNELWRTEKPLLHSTHFENTMRTNQFCFNSSQQVYLTVIDKWNERTKC